MIDHNTPLMATPTSPIMDHHIEVNQPEGSNMAMVRDLLEDPHIQPRMMQSALSAVTSLCTPNRPIQAPEMSYLIIPPKVPACSVPNNTDRTNINRKLNTYKDRLTLELSNFKKKQPEMWGKIEVECAKLNLKLEFDHKLRHQTMTLTETIDVLR